MPIVLRACPAGHARGSKTAEILHLTSWWTKQISHSSIKFKPSGTGSRMGAPIDQGGRSMVGRSRTRVRKNPILLLSVILIACHAMFSTTVQDAQAVELNAPSFAVGASTSFYLYDDTSPKTYMMFQSEPSGTNQNVTNGTYTFYSDTWTSD